MKRINIKKYKFKAFTLIEILIATGIFVLVMVVLSQVYISIVRSERVAYALLSAENNLRNNLELIARSIRMGKNFEISLDGKFICFDYYLDTQWRKICYQYEENKGNIFQSIENTTNGFEPLFDPNIKITKAYFYKKGDLQQKTSQLTIVISLESKIEVRNQEYFFHLETAITPRVFVKES